MPFFTRPDLEDRQFRQESTSQLTMSGVTNFFGTLKSKGVEIDATTGGTYPNANIALGFVDGKIQLALVTGGTGSGSTIYNGASPTTCTVGGLSAGTEIFGCEINNILERILVPTLNPEVCPPFNGLSLSVSSPQEVGTLCNVTLNATFNQGCVCPSYCGGPSVRSGLPTFYYYTGGTSFSDCNSSSLLTDATVDSSHIVTFGNNSWCSCVDYSAGLNILNSSGGVACSALGAGSTGFVTRSINGIYPIYYGKLTCGTRPPVTQELITGGTKSVVCSTGTVTIDFNSGTNEYTWLAIPATSTSKTCWYVTPLDNGCIGTSPIDKYPDECLISIDSGQGCWSGVNYKVYMSGTVGEITDPIQFRNS
jgi:hypothetical protein